MATEPISKAITTFALHLYKTLGDNDRSANVFFSPLSISSALAMVLLGAGGNTATQMSECLKTQDLSGDVHPSFATLLQEFNKPDAPYALSVANRLYGEQTYQFIKDFLRATQKYYKAELQTVDFIKKFEEARVTINTWVEQQTQGKIKDLLAKGTVTAATSLVLVNAIYFKGNWNEKFDESSTRDGQFKINKVEQQLTYEKLMEWTGPQRMRKKEVHVELPRFKMEEKYNLKDVLISMGMVDAFSIDSSDFSGMSPAKDLFLSEAVHKAFVEVNEEGTEAAAATAILVTDSLTRGSRPPARFIADHPFLFFIRHNASNTILFTGRYCSPE